jgi:hypothetical protein
MEFFEKLKKFMGFPARQESPEFDNKDRYMLHLIISQFFVISRIKIFRYWGPPPSSHDE